MKRTPYTAKDFAWVKMTPKQIQKFAGEALELKTLNYKKIKAILPEHRTFENTVYALEISDGEYGDIFQQIGILGEVSPSKDVRDAVHTVMTEMSQKLVDIEYDKGLYTALVEYHEGNFEDEKKKLMKNKDVRKEWLEYLARFPHVSEFYRSAPQYKNQISVVNGKKAGTDINLYKLFVED
jgi:Zn-dependent oligopeptidase